MKQARVDTSEFRAHSARGTYAFKNKAKGLFCQEMAKWENKSTFRRHYLREIGYKKGQDSFQATVLQG